MKAALTTVLLTLLCLVNLRATGLGSLSIDAHEAGTASTFYTHWQTDWGSYDRDNHQSTQVLVSVHDMSRKIPRASVDIFFIACDQGSQKWQVYKRTSVPIEFNGSIEVNGYVTSPSIKSNEQKLAAIGQDDVTGLKMVGWIVVGKVDDAVFGVRASNQTLLEIAEGNPRQALTLAALIANSPKSATASR